MKVQTRGLTVEALAAHKRLPADFLRDRLGWHDLSGGGVGIPYWDLAGEPLPVKRRLGLSASTYRWPRDTAIEAYGLWRLDRARKYGELILVEGETDTAALLLHGFGVLGLPGADSGRCTLLKSYLDGIERLYIHQEPGIGGEKFLRGCLHGLRLCRYAGAAYALTMPDGVKDPCELPRPDFEAVMRERLRAAVQLPPEWWSEAAALRSMLSEALRDPSPYFKRLLLDVLAEDLGALVATLVKGAGRG